HRGLSTVKTRETAFLCAMVALMPAPPSPRPSRAGKGAVRHVAGVRGYEPAALHSHTPAGQRWGHCKASRDFRGISSVAALLAVFHGSLDPFPFLTPVSLKNVSLFTKRAGTAGTAGTSSIHAGYRAGTYPLSVPVMFFCGNRMEHFIYTKWCVFPLFPNIFISGNCYRPRIYWQFPPFPPFPLISGSY